MNQPYYDNTPQMSISDIVEQPMVNPTPQALVPDAVPEETVETAAAVEETVATTEPSLLSKVENYRNSIQGSLGTIGVPASNKKGTIVKGTTVQKESASKTTTTKKSEKRGLSPLATAIVGGGIGAISLGIAGMSAYTMHKEEKETHEVQQSPEVVVPTTEAPTEAVKDQDYYSQFFDIPYEEDE